MQIEPLAIPDVLLLRPRVFADGRGSFAETFNQAAWAQAGLFTGFVQDNHVVTEAAGVLRGLHYQLPPAAQAKLIRVVRGAIVDVAVDLRRSSKTFGHHVKVELKAGDWRQLFIPIGFAHGYLTLEPNTEVQYKVSAGYAPDLERGIRWNDPALAIDWGIAEPVLSERDRTLPLLTQQTARF